LEAFDRQLGLGYHGAALHTTTLCNTLVATALGKDPDLAPDVGVDPAWVSSVLMELDPTPVDDVAHAHEREELEQRVRTLEKTIGEHPENPEYIDEVRAGDYMKNLRNSLVRVAREPLGRDLINRALVAVQNNPYPRYRDLGLVAIGEAALAVPEPAWTRARLEAILETGLEKEGITFTFDLATQLSTEAARRGLSTGDLGAYLKAAATSSDRWGTRMRSTSAVAAAQFAQGDNTTAFATLESAAAFDQGFAGYMSAHLLTLASRWSEFNASTRIGSLNLISKATSQAQRVRDPQFSGERQKLVEQFDQWLGQATPDWSRLSAMLRNTVDPDTRRAYKDLVTARWAAEGHWKDWGHVVVATLADATAVDFVLARLAGYAIRRHHSGARELMGAELAEAIDLCAQRFATSRPWDFIVAAEYV
jgi:hypothetical protein